MSSHTIVALATPPGRGGIAIVRLSGPEVKSIATALLGKIPTPRYASCLPFRDENKEIIDEGIALFFPNPHSFTGEDILELQGHGGPAVVDRLIQRILHLGARLARPGEFSERAFLNNKIDLAQAEAIADLIDASSEQAARSAMRSLQGEFSKRIHVLVEGVIQLRMYIEAAIDFAEEEIDFLADHQIERDFATLLQQLSEIKAAAMQGSLLRDGITLVIAGQPNVGKSSLLNCLSGKNSAIVTDIPGTTRDVLREQITLEGMPLHVIDTAGLRDSDDVVEKEGIRRAQAEIARADLILHVIDASRPVEAFKLDSEEPLPRHVPLVRVRNKIDLCSEVPYLREQDGEVEIGLSAKTQQGIDLLRKHIVSCVGLKTTSEGSFSARRRHLDALERTATFLHEAQRQLQTHRAGECVAEELRQAQLALCEITGEFTTDDLLGKIFSSFCVGK